MRTSAERERRQIELGTTGEILLSVTRLKMEQPRDNQDRTPPGYPPNRLRPRGASRPLIPRLSLVAINTSGKWWTGSAPEDIEDYLRAYSADGYPVARVIIAECRDCGSRSFSVRVDDVEGCAERTCTECGRTELMSDSAKFVDHAELEGAQCPCGGEIFNVAGGFALRDNGDIRWVYVGLRCQADGVLGCYGEWKIDYSPTSHLFTQV